MTDPRSIESRTNEVAERLAAVESIARGGSGDVLVLTELDHDDPRLAPLVAQARRDGRMLVTPWAVDDAGELVDTSGAGYLPATAEPAATDDAWEVVTARRRPRGTQANGRPRPRTTP